MSITHYWNGSVLTVTSDSGTSAANLQGPKGDTGPRGPQGPAGVVYDVNGNIVLEGYATEQYVNDMIAAQGGGGADVDLSDYATINYVNAAIANIKIPDVSAYQTEAQVIALINANMPASGDEVSY